MAKCSVTNFTSSKHSFLNQIPPYKTKLNKSQYTNVFNESKTNHGHMRMSKDTNHKIWMINRSNFNDVKCGATSSLISESEIDTDDVEMEMGSELEKKTRERRKKKDDIDERVVSIDRVSKTVKGGRKISFRAVVVVGDGKGRVGVGNASAKEVVLAVDKAKLVARKKMISFPMNPKTSSFPHPMEVKIGACKVMLRPAVDGTGVIAGGAVRTVLEMAGVKNGFGKQLRSNNPMNNAKATIEALKRMRDFKSIAKDRDVSLDFLLGKTTEKDLKETEKVEES